MDDTLTPVDLEQNPVADDLNDQRDAWACAQTFYQYERFRTQNHDPRWTRADELYFGYVKQKLWEGTNVRRSSLPVEIAFDHVQSALPIIVSSLFGSSGDWFEVDPEPGTSMEDALAQKAVMRYIFEHPAKKFGGNAVQEMVLAIQSMLHYGNGGIRIQYNPDTKLPEIEWVDLRDIYIDPSCPSPSVDESRSLIERKLMTVDQLEDLRGQEGFKIPPREKLLDMAKHRPRSIGDTTIEISASINGEAYNMADEFQPDPSQRFVEVLIEWRPSRVTWIANREKLLYNEANDYGFIPHCFSPCYNVLRRFYAEGIPERQEYNQRYIEALVNSHLDEIHLAINPMRAYQQGVGLNPNSLRTAPGRMVATPSDPKTSLMFYTPPGVTTNVWEEVGWIQGRAEARTGLNSMTVQGIPLQSNASRTAAGINAQSQGPLSRMKQLVQNVENYMLIPMLYKVSAILDKMTEEGDVLPGYGPQGQAVQVPAGVFKKGARFRMLASSKMLTQEKLGGMLPIVSQFLLAGPFLQAVGEINKTVDADVLTRFFQDATGTAAQYPFIRPMNQQEIQAKQTPPPQVQAMMQAKQMDAQVRTQVASEKANTQLQIAALSHQSKSDAQAEKSALALLDMFLDDMKAKVSSMKESLINGQPAATGNSETA